MVKVNNKSSKSDHLRAKKKVKKVLNPFEVHVNKEKIKVLGRKSKNDRGLPGIARAKAITKVSICIYQNYIFNVFIHSEKYNIKSSYTFREICSYTFREI